MTVSVCHSVTYPPSPAPGERVLRLPLLALEPSVQERGTLGYFLERPVCVRLHGTLPSPYPTLPSAQNPGTKPGKGNLEIY